MPYYSIVMVSIGSSTGLSTRSPSVSSFSSGECAMLLNFSGTVSTCIKPINPQPFVHLPTNYYNAIHYNYTVPYNLKNGGKQVIIKTFKKGRV